MQSPADESHHDHPPFQALTDALTNKAAALREKYRAPGVELGYVLSNMTGDAGRGSQKVGYKVQSEGDNTQVSIMWSPVLLSASKMQVV